MAAVGKALHTVTREATFRPSGLQSPKCSAYDIQRPRAAALGIGQ
jgi:hypothetical protein